MLLLLPSLADITFISSCHSSAQLMHSRAVQVPLRRVHTPVASQRASIVPLTRQADFVLQLTPRSVLLHAWPQEAVLVPFALGSVSRNGVPVQVCVPAMRKTMVSVYVTRVPWQMQYALSNEACHAAC
jgi:hypothetical protein